MEMTEDMLQAAMKKAIEHGLLPRRQSPDLYLQNKVALEDILKTALQVINVPKPLPTSMPRIKAGGRTESSNLSLVSTRQTAACDKVINLHERRQASSNPTADFG